MKNYWIFLIFLVASMRAESKDMLSGYTETEHYILYYESLDQAIAEQLLLTLENNYAKVSADLRVDLRGKVQVAVYPDLLSMHEAIGKPDAPSWLVGHYNSSTRTISLVSPANPGPRHSYQSIFHSARHQLTQAFLCDNYAVRKLPKWLTIGIAMYESDQSFLAQKVLQQASQNPSLIPSIDQLVQLSDFETFNKIGGFAFSYALIDFIQTQWGWDAVLSLLEENTYLEINTQVFREQWIDFIRAHYS